MICPKCKGSRAVFERFENTVVLGRCPMCDGLGEIKGTNFQRITASPEALAEFMDKLSYACIDCGEKGPEYHNENCPFGDFGNCADRGSMFLWLKEESKE